MDRTPVAITNNAQSDRYLVLISQVASISSSLPVLILILTTRLTMSVLDLTSCNVKREQYPLPLRGCLYVNTPYEDPEWVPGAPVLSH